MPKKVNSYYDYVKCNRQNRSVPGFDFDVNQFENLIDCWTSFDDIPVILNCSKCDLDRFCSIVYKLDYASTYRILSGVTDAYMKKTLKNLASSGNATAINIVTEHFMKLKKDEDDKSINIRILNDLSSPSFDSQEDGGVHNDR